VYALELSNSHVAQHGERADPDPERIAVGGDLAGGNPTAVTTLVSRDRGGPAIAHQLLVSPAVPSSVLDDPDSYEENATGSSVCSAWSTQPRTPSTHLPQAS